MASGDGGSRLWLRSLGTTAAQPLAGTEGGSSPFWSPDNRSIGFFEGSALKRLDVGGGGAEGAPQTLAPVISGQGGTWNTDGVIVFAPSNTARLMRVSASGGGYADVTTLGPQQTGHLAPYFLPDGRRFLFYVRGAPETAGNYMGALDGSAPTRLIPADSAGVYLPADAFREGGPEDADAFPEEGWLLWVRADALVAQRLDVERSALVGESEKLADAVAVNGFFRSAISVSATGRVAYRTGADSHRQLTWMDRSGRTQGTIGDSDSTLSTPRVSPDGSRVVVARAVQGNLDLWLLDAARTSRFTFDAARDDRPVWSPDGTRIVFRSARTGLGDLYQKLTSGAGMEERVLASDRPLVPHNWSADGRFLLYHSTDQQTDADLWVVPMARREPQGRPDQSRGMAGERTPSVFLKSPFREVLGVFSPDGRWVAYMSNESGRPEIYVRPFVPPSPDASADTPGGQWQVSTAGGIHPVWRPDGRELYYLGPTGSMMAAPVTASGATLEPGIPVTLFSTRIVGGGVEAQQGRQYDVAPNGRFLINTELDSAAAPITILMNWNPEAKKK